MHHACVPWRLVMTVTALSRHHDALWTSTADNDYIDIDDGDTRDSR